VFASNLLLGLTHRERKVNGCSILKGIVFLSYFQQLKRVNASNNRTINDDDDDSKVEFSP
jgi:hypothetical protein